MDKQSNNKENYYDLITNMTFVRGHKSQKVEDVKSIIHPEVFPSIYSISKDGQVYCIIDDQYLKWDFIGKYPSVSLICKNINIDGESNFSKKRFLIKDLMACSYIANANDYLERGYKIVNLDGNPKNCNYRNIIFIDPNKKY